MLYESLDHNQKPKLIINVLTTYSRSHDLKVTPNMWKRPASSSCLASLLMVVNNDSFECLKAGLFTSNKGNKAEVCATLCARPVHMDYIRICCKRLVHIAERTGGKQRLAALKFLVVKLLSSMLGQNWADCRFSFQCVMFTCT